MPPARFYLGKIFNLQTGAVDPASPLLYDPAHLTTHGIITGMTGSGKTGLGIGLLEEAALQGIPALILDPKGDLTNLLLHFPELRPADFEPWIDPDEARRQSKDVPTLAKETAEKWATGLNQWGLGPDQIRALSTAANYTIFTPGSTSGVPINILSSFRAPEISWSENSEVLREKIATTVTALLSLVGVTDIDPLRSREHILLSNLIEFAWSQGKSLELTDLIIQTQKPPFERLGAFPVDNFYPEKDRFELSMLLNNILATPSFQTWLQGEPLEIQSLLYTADGKPRHSIFYLAHLSDRERMFFVTLLFAAAEAWMRSQRGTSGLRALIYFDEIVGYLPPLGNPPSRPILLRMLKQARAFGVGLLLATQNPVDVDYKALSNAGTWLIGRLQTDQDKQRLMDGLESASGGNLKRADIDKLISGLQKRVFLLHNINNPAPLLFSTRWTMNFLAGPMTRAQIPALNKLWQPAVPVTAPVSSTAVPSTPAGAVSLVPPAATVTPTAAAAPVVKVAQPVKPPEDAEFSAAHPNVPTGAAEYFIPNQLGVSQAVSAAKIQNTGSIETEGLVYRPALLAQAEVRYSSTKFNLQASKIRTALVLENEKSFPEWEDAVWTAFDAKQLGDDPLPNTRFAALPGWLADAKRLAGLQKDYIDWVYRTGTLQINANVGLKTYALDDVTTAEFREKCADSARLAMKTELDKVEKAYTTRLRTLEKKLSTQKLEVEDSQTQLNQRNLEMLGAGAEFALGLIGKRKKSLSTSLSKGRLTEKAKNDLREDKLTLETLEKELRGLEAEKTAALKEVQDRWAQMVNDVTTVPLAPMKKDIYVDLFGIAWLPYYVIRVNQVRREIPAFETAR